MIFQPKVFDFPENDVRSFAIDSQEIKWIGTATSGLIRMDDSLNLTIYNKENSVIQGSVEKLFLDSEENLWINTYNPNELFLYSRDNYSIKKIERPEAQNIGQVTSIAENSKGEIFIGGKNGLIKYDKSTWQKIKLPENAQINTIDISPNDIIAIGHNNGLIVGKEGDWITHKSHKYRLQEPIVSGLKFENDSTLIIGYDEIFFDVIFSIKKGGKWKNFRKSDSNLFGRNINKVIDIERDNKAIYWILTDKYIIKFNGKEIIGGKYAFNPVLDVLIANDKVWLVTDNGISTTE